MSRPKEPQPHQQPQQHQQHQVSGVPYRVTFKEAEVPIAREEVFGGQVPPSQKGGQLQGLEVQDLIYEECEFIKDFLLNKNRKYGNSALNPTRIFSRSDAVEQLRVRIDDKLSREISSQDDDDEDIVLDLIGYLILLRIALREKNSE